MFRKLYIASTILLLLTACLPVGQLEVGVETAPPETAPTSEGTPPGEPSQTPTEETPAGAAQGTVTGKACYPSEAIPAQYIYFRNAATGQLTEFTTENDQLNFEFELVAGTYEAFAYLNNADLADPLGGTYSQAVICGLGVDCFDHSLVQFAVEAGQTTANVDICDWYDQLAVPVFPRAVFATDPALAGLIYQNLTENSVWQVDANGNATPVLATAELNAALSPDSSQVLYHQQDDIWLGDLSSGTWRNLTQTPDRVEYFPLWVPGTDLVAFSSYGLETDAQGNLVPPDAIAWQLTVIHLDGTDYEVVDTGAMWGGPAASPDGTRIAYDVGGEARLYVLGSGVEAFDLAQYGLTGIEKISAPAFSPDGTKLAWWVGGPITSGDWQNALAVFDLQAGSVTLLHPYTPLAGEGFFNPVWSPDGVWLASIVVGDGSRGALWALRADGGEEVNLGNGAYPLWSASGNTLLFTLWADSGPAQEAMVVRVLIGDWGLNPLTLPPGSFPLGWGSGQ